MTPKTLIRATGFRPLKDNVFVTGLDRGPRRSRHGILLPDDDMTARGIRPRWGQVWRIGPDVTEVKPGDWVLIEHARWTTAIEIQLPDETVCVWRIEWPKAVLLAADRDPREYQPSVL